MSTPALCIVGIGHGFKDNTVHHPYFGSMDVIRDLSRLPGWDRGCIEFQDGCMERSTKTDLICGFDLTRICTTIEVI